MKKLLNNQGSALQIVLVTFLIMNFSLTTCLFLIHQKVTHYQHIDLMMKQKNLEILLVKYYVEEMQEGVLMSDDYEDDDYLIESYVDDMGSFYEITTHVESLKMNYEFIVDINTTTFEVSQFEYKKEG